jgi:hypothetical protein
VVLILINDLVECSASDLVHNQQQGNFLASSSSFSQYHAHRQPTTLLQIRQLYKNVLCQFDEDEDCPVPMAVEENGIALPMLAMDGHVIRMAKDFPIQHNQRCFSSQLANKNGPSPIQKQ